MKLAKYSTFRIALILITGCLPLGSQLHAAADPCRVESRNAGSAAQDYRAAAREVASICTKAGGDCTAAEMEAEMALNRMFEAHQLMVDICGETTPPPPPAVAPETPGDLVITEIMINPSAVTDQAGEWFEIHNPTATDFDLQGLVIRDDGLDSHQIASSVILPAGGFVVMGNNADMNTNGGVLVDYVYSNFALANTADEIELLNGTTSIDKVAYSDLLFFPIPSGAAISLDPGFFDEISNDVGVYWCQAVDMLSGGDFGSPGSTNPDCAGPPSPPPPAVVPQTPGDLVITEIMFDPFQVADSAGEWFEIYNPTATNFQLQGLIISDDGSNIHQIADSLILPAGGFVVLGNNSDISTNGGVTVDYVYSSFALANTGDEIEISDGSTTFDKVIYGFNAIPSGTAASLDPDFFDALSNDLEFNWCPAVNLLTGGDFGSPGAVNPDCP